MALLVHCSDELAGFQRNFSFPKVLCPSLHEISTTPKSISGNAARLAGTDYTVSCWLCDLRGFPTLPGAFRRRAHRKQKPQAAKNRKTIIQAKLKGE
jgi:hypothetical protein